jgi:hypothetical protein
MFPHISGDNGEEKECINQQIKKHKGWIFGRSVRALVFSRLFFEGRFRMVNRGKQWNKLGINLWYVNGNLWRASRHERRHASRHEVRNPAHQLQHSSRLSLVLPQGNKKNN